MLGLNYARDYIIRGGGPWGLRVMQWELIIPIRLEHGKTRAAENRPVQLAEGGAGTGERRLQGGTPQKLKRADVTL